MSEVKESETASAAVAKDLQERWLAISWEADLSKYPETELTDLKDDDALYLAILDKMIRKGVGELPAPGIVERLIRLPDDESMGYCCIDLCHLPKGFKPEFFLVDEPGLFGIRGLQVEKINGLDGFMGRGSMPYGEPIQHELAPGVTTRPNWHFSVYGVAADEGYRVIVCRTADVKTEIVAREDFAKFLS